MIICLDVGNTQIHGGVFDQDKMILQFRRTSKDHSSSDEYGLFLRSILRENDMDPLSVEKISICSVVPDKLYSLRNACRKYFKMTPFVLQPGTKTGLKIKYKNPVEVGADRIANAVAATHLYPEDNKIIVDFGTATTMCVVNKNKEYLGGVILPGVRMSMEALEGKTAKLPSVEIVKKEQVIGQSTIESIQSGLFHGQMGAVRELITLSQKEAFGGEPSLVIATGGFSALFNDKKLFQHVIPNLALQGLYLALKYNQ